jgi:hypothetical protein
VIKLVYMSLTKKPFETLFEIDKIIYDQYLSGGGSGCWDILWEE